MKLSVEYRALDAPAIESQPSWYGQFRCGGHKGLWLTAVSKYGAIRYTTPEAAVAGAEVFFKFGE